jgi:hypothetical protein
MQVNPKIIREFLKKAHFESHGDQFEQDFGHYLSEKFPNCERFWRVFIVPLTRRIYGYPDRIVRDIWFKQPMPKELEDIVGAHYSIFLHLIYAHLHLEAKMPSSLEDIYTHLSSTCDLVEKVIERWFLLLGRCQGGMAKDVLQDNREDFLKRMGKVYDKEYSAIYEHYFSKGKTYPLRPPMEDDLMKKYFGKSDRIRKKYKGHAKSIREFRNIIVHDVKIGRIIERNGKTLIPKPNVIQNYRSWRQVEAVADNEDILLKDFAEQYQQSREDLSILENLINTLWDKLINDFEEEFYSQERTALREIFDIEFSEATSSALYTPEIISDNIEYDISASGTAQFRYGGNKSA